MSRAVTRGEGEDGPALDALLAAIADGSERALEDFYRASHARIYAFALKRLGDPVAAAEVLNEVMLEVWRHAARFEGRSRVMTWVLGIAHHKVLDVMRRRGRDAAHETIDDSLADEDTPTSFAVLAGADDAVAVRRCLEGLSDAHRAVVHLAFFEDASYAEIADIVACPLGTVKTRMMHAKNALKRCLESLGAGN